MADRRPHRSRRSPDLVTLLFGVGSLLVSAATLTGDSGRLPGGDPRWLLAGGAVLVGALLLIGTLHRPRDRR